MTSKNEEVASEIAHRFAGWNLDITSVDQLKAAITAALEARDRAHAEELAEYQRRSELNPLSGYSCNGINVWGNEKSMKAVREAFHRVPFLQQVNEELRRRLDAALADQPGAGNGDK